MEASDYAASETMMNVAKSLADAYLMISDHDKALVSYKNSLMMAEQLVELGKIVPDTFFDGKFNCSL